MCLSCVYHLSLLIEEIKRSLSHPTVVTEGEVVFVVCLVSGPRGEAYAASVGDEGRGRRRGIDLSERILLLSCK